MKVVNVNKVPVVQSHVSISNNVFGEWWYCATKTCGQLGSQRPTLSFKWRQIIYIRLSFSPTNAIIILIMNPAFLRPCTCPHHVFLFSFLISRASLNLVTPSYPCHFLVLQHAVCGAWSVRTVNAWDRDGITQIKQKFADVTFSVCYYVQLFQLCCSIWLSAPYKTAPKWEVI